MAPGVYPVVLCAGSVAAVIEMVRAGTLPSQGFLRQEQIPLAGFLDTPTGRLFTQ